MMKIIIGLIIFGAIAVIANEWRLARNKEKVSEKLHDELDDVQADLRKADVEEDVVDAKVKLKVRKAAIDKKAEVLDKKDGAVAPKKKAAPKKVAKKKKAAPKKKVAKKKAVPKKKTDK